MQIWGRNLLYLTRRSSLLWTREAAFEKSYSLIIWFYFNERAPWKRTVGYSITNRLCVKRSGPTTKKRNHKKKTRKFKNYIKITVYWNYIDEERGCSWTKQPLQTKNGQLTSYASFYWSQETSNFSLKSHQASHTSQDVGSIKRHRQQRHPPFLVGAIPLVALTLLEGPNDTEWLWVQFLGAKPTDFLHPNKSSHETNGYGGYGYGGFLKWWYPTTMGLPTQNWCFGGITIYGNTHMDHVDKNHHFGTWEAVFFLRKQ